jgi:hypothetical protein
MRAVWAGLPDEETDSPGFSHGGWANGLEAFEFGGYSGSRLHDAHSGVSEPAEDVLRGDLS